MSFKISLFVLPILGLLWNLECDCLCCRRYQNMDEVQSGHDEVLAESLDENVTNSINIAEGEPSVGDSLIVPSVGVQFKDLQEMFKCISFFYNELICNYD